ncbi:uncharacterized protein N7483_006813 [Penicillium malachiteum]|uniref:uncharacterized protein n=1 Tax=Penicillium malachiteum TaxID=1324776 RepID=UPI00254723C5|nr:uncharacterized protein N7483_006813 [Penicillium malachiteum]KAJ5725456.1 hypothetical protein N7483_006813 [Penicillium malachiteum]
MSNNLNEDHPKHHDATETTSIKFEWTPELVKIGTSRGAIHPSIGPLEISNGLPECKYRPDMTLPDPADTCECLKWVGLSDQKIIEFEQKFNDLFPKCQAPKCGYDEKYQAYGRGFNEITFPSIDSMLRLFIQGMGDDHEEFQYTHSFRPEFAIFCGLHKDDPRALEDPDLFEKTWFRLGPADIMGDTLISFWGQLKEFMVTRLLYEGKAWKDRYGIWLLREGEDMDQAKARMNEKERERLREQAREEKKADLARQKQERDREYAEDMARFAEDRVPAEMTN